MLCVGCSVVCETHGVCGLCLVRMCVHCVVWEVCGACGVSAACVPSVCVCVCAVCGARVDGFCVWLSV